MQLLKKTLKKLAVAGVGVAMLGMSLTGALAADYTLGDYPAPYKGDVNTVLVVGSAAADADVTAREDIAYGLTETTTSLTTEEGDYAGAELEFETGEMEDMQLGTALSVSTAFNGKLDDTDNVGLSEGEININIGSDADYDFHEEIRFTSSATTGTALSIGDEDFEDQIVLTLAKESMLYNVTFEDALAAGNYFNDTTTSNDIDLNFLGKDLTVRGATAAAVTAVIGDKVLLKAGDSLKVDGHTVKFVKASISTALIEIDGESYSKGTGETLDKKGVEVYIDSVFDEEDPSQESAVLVVGAEAVKTYSNGNHFWDEDESQFLWKWNLANLDSATPQIGIALAKNMNDPSKKLDSKITALGLTKTDSMFLTEGDYLCLPHKYACLVFDSIMGDQELKDVTFDFSDETEDLYPTSTSSFTADVSAAEVVIVDTNIGENKGLVVDGEDTKSLVIYNNNTGLVVYAYNKDDGYYRLTTKYAPNGTTADLFQIEYGDYNVAVETVVNASGYFNFSIDSEQDGNNITFGGKTVAGTTTAGMAFDYLGYREGEDLSGNHMWYGSTVIDSYSYDVLTNDGVKIFDPENNLDNDRIKLAVPNDNEYKVQLNVAMVKGMGSSSTTTTTVEPATMLDTEVTDATAYNIIAVGGPAINEVSAALMGLPFPSFGANSGIAEGKALVKVVPNGDNWALVVAGYGKENTLAAASVLKNYAAYDMAEKSEVVVEGTTSTGVTVA